MMKNDTHKRQFLDLIMKDCDLSRDGQILAAEIERRGVVPRNRSVFSSLLPYCIGDTHYKKFETLTRVLTSVIEKIVTAYLRGDDFEGMLESNTLLEELIRIDPHYSQSQVIQRYDLIYDRQTNDIKVIEFNCSDPSGMGWNDMYVEVFEKMSTMERIVSSYNVRFQKMLDSHLATLIEKYRQYCVSRAIPIKEKPSIAVVCCKKMMPVPSDLEMMVAYFKTRDHAAYYADTCEFEYDGTRLIHQNQEIDIVYRDAMGHFTDEELWPRARHIIDAYRNGNVCLINPVSSVVGGFKSVLAIITDACFADLFNADELAFIRECIPWTRLVSDTTTDYTGEVIDLIPYITANKERFVLKPSNGYGGRDVFIGKLTEQSCWENAINACVVNHDLLCVQEYVDVPAEMFVMHDNGKIKCVEQKVTLGAWAHSGEFVGMYARMSSDPVVNVCRGGGFVPACFVSQR